MLNGEQRPQHPQISPVDNMLPSSVRNITGYPSPTEPTQPLHMLQDSYEHPPPFDGMYIDRRHSNGRRPPTSLRVDTRVAHATNADGHRTFPCTSCGKGFARRSDLARHERIHSNIRPHICPEPNCNKQFIQRSALTVHMRVHTGKPTPHDDRPFLVPLLDIHKVFLLCMQEVHDQQLTLDVYRRKTSPMRTMRKGKWMDLIGAPNGFANRILQPFSDSSSLARHRRIHSGVFI